jgi:hypothetical protein
MNKQIQSIMGKTLDSEFSHTWTTMTYEDLLRFSEKFAELIVGQCAEIAVTKNNGMIYPAEVSSYVTAGKVDSAKMIKQHFGVE